MKNKAFLSILEQLCMILIFAAAAAVCLRVFSLANEISENRDTLDRAVVAAEHTAELLKSTGGDLAFCAEALSGTVNDETLTVFYDRSGSSVSSLSDAYFILTAVKTAPPHILTEGANITVTKNGTSVFSLEVVWQTERIGPDYEK